jgi:hypothetical protein
VLLWEQQLGRKYRRLWLQLRLQLRRMQLRMQLWRMQQ